MPGGMEGYGLNLSRGVSGAGGGRQGWVQTGCDPGVAQHQRGICISVFSWLEDGLGMDGVAIEVCLKPTEDGPHGDETDIVSAHFPRANSCTFHLPNTHKSIVWCV